MPDATLSILIKAEDEASVSIAKIKDEFKNIDHIATKGSGAASRALDGISKQVLRASGRIENFGKSIKDGFIALDDATKPLQAASAGLLTAGAASAKIAIDFENNFASVKKTVEGTPEQLEAIKRGIIDLTTVGIGRGSAIPATTADLAALAAAGGQLGISTENIVEFTATMAQLGSATNLVGEEGAATMARYANVMKIPQNEIRNVGSAIVDLGNNSATTEAEIAEMALRMGKYGQTIGMSAADVLGYSAALSSLGIEAQLGGSAVGRTWLAIETAVASGGKELQAFAKYSGKSAKEFQDQWNTDSRGAFNGLLKGIKSAENLTLALGELGINNTQDIQAMMALVNGVDLVTESVERANTAYKENTALQTEFDAKAKTTASQLVITKNNIAEIARSFGDFIVPSVAGASENIRDFTRGLAELSDEQKSGIVNAVKNIAIAGVATKGLLTVGKGIGDFTKGIGAIAPKAMAIATACPPATAAIAGLGLAVTTGKIAYDEWYKSEYRWSDGLLESNKKIRESISSFQEISALKKELQDLKLVIENPESSSEQIDKAKSQLDEIVALLEREYNLVINSDKSNLNNAVENLVAKTENELQANINNQMAKLADLRGEVASYEADYAREAANYQAALDDQTKYSEAINQASLLNRQYKEGKISIYERNKATKDLVRNLGLATTAEQGYGQDMAAIRDALNDATDATEKYGNRMNVLTASKEEYIAISTELANWETELISRYAKQGNNEGVNKAIATMKTLITDAGLDLKGYTEAAILAKNGIVSLDDAWKSGGETLDNIVKDYITVGQQLGMTSNEAIVGASLIKNGFKSISEVSAAGKLDVVIQQMNELAQSMNLIPENKRIEVDANGNISILDKTTNKIEQIQSENVIVSVDANGNLSVLDEASGKIQLLHGIGNVHVQVNAEGNIDILDEAEQKIATVDGETGLITINAEYPGAEEISQAIKNQGDLRDTEVDTTVNGDYPGKEDIETALEHQDKLKDKKVTYTVSYVQIGTPPAQFAYSSVRHQSKGTQNFPGGLAMVNDQTGISDPRELIVDHGRAFIPQGRNVLLPLSRGAKVYTAAQTKAIMSALGVPMYASGKDNSDGFIAARDNLTHRKSTTAMSVTDELAEWVKLSEQFKSNQHDVWDIQEQIYSLTRKQTDELNEQSKAYIKERTALADWSEYGDDPMSAYNHVKERNLAEFSAGRMTWQEYTDTMSEFGELMLDERISQSEKWLDRERKYNDMSVNDYIAGLNRIQEYTLQYYEQGLINYKTYRKAASEINDKYLDAIAESNNKEYSAWEKSMNNWINIRDTYGDWNEFGDSLSQTYARAIIRQEEFYNAGLISWQECEDAKLEYSLEMYRAASNEYEAVLAKQSERILEMQSKFAEEEKLLRASWEVKDRSTDIAEVERQMAIYENAATDAGQEKYKELLEQKEQLEREERLYQLQVDNNATLDKLKTEYDEMEANKKNVLARLKVSSYDIATTNADISADVERTREIANEIGIRYTAAAESTLNTLSDIASILTNIQKRMGSGGNSNTYNDSRNITFNSGLSDEGIARVINGVVVGSIENIF